MSVIIQQSYTQELVTAHGSDMTDMLRLTYQRHAAYARAHKLDYWHLIGEFNPIGAHLEKGGWVKIQLMLAALAQGHEDAIWIDADAAIVDLETDLRTALTYGKVGACLHDAEWFKEPQWSIPPHYNVGVTFARQGAQAFLAEWLAKYPGDKRWAEQGAFNDLTKEEKYRGIFEPLPAKWNATVNVNECENPVIKGWHGIFPVGKRLAMMRETFVYDHLIYKVV